MTDVYKKVDLARLMELAGMNAATDRAAILAKLSPEQRKWLGGADPTDPYIMARMRKAVPDQPTAAKDQAERDDAELAASMLANLPPTIATAAPGTQAGIKAVELPATPVTTQSATKEPAATPTPGSYQAIAQLNKIADPNKIYPGQKINLGGGAEYTVAPGDTLSAIAQGQYKGQAPSGAEIITPAPAQAPTPNANAAEFKDVNENQSGLGRLAELAGIKKKVTEADADWSARPTEAPRVSIDDILSGRAKPELATNLPGGPPAPAAIAQPLEPRSQEPDAEISAADREKLKTAVVQPTSQSATPTDVKPATVSSFGTTDTGRATRIDPRAKYLRPEAERLAREKELEPLAKELVPGILTAPIGGAVTGAVAKPVIGAIGRQLAKRAGSEIAKDVGAAAGREAGRDIARAAPRTDYVDPAKKIRDIERARPGQPAPQPSGTAPSSAAPRPTGEPPVSIHDKPVDLEKAAELVAQAEKTAAQKATVTAIPQPAVAPRGAEQLAKRMEVGQQRLDPVLDIIKATGERPYPKAAGTIATGAAAAGIPYAGYKVYSKMQEPEVKAEIERRKAELAKDSKTQSVTATPTPRPTPSTAPQAPRPPEIEYWRPEMRPLPESVNDELSRRIDLLKTQLAEYKLQEAGPELKEIPPHREYTPSPEVETAAARRYAKQKLIQMGVTDPKKLDAAMKKWEKGVRAAQKKQT